MSQFVDQRDENEPYRANHYVAPRQEVAKYTAGVKVADRAAIFNRKPSGASFNSQSSFSSANLRRVTRSRSSTIAVAESYKTSTQFTVATVPIDNEKVTEHTRGLSVADMPIAKAAAASEKVADGSIVLEAESAADGLKAEATTASEQVVDGSIIAQAAEKLDETHVIQSERTVDETPVLVDNSLHTSADASNQDFDSAASDSYTMAEESTFVQNQNQDETNYALATPEPPRSKVSNVAKTPFIALSPSFAFEEVTMTPIVNSSKASAEDENDFSPSLGPSALFSEDSSVDHKSPAAVDDTDIVHAATADTVAERTREEMLRLVSHVKIAERANGFIAKQEESATMGSPESVHSNKRMPSARLQPKMTKISFSTNVSKMNTCPKCSKTIYKMEEIIAVGSAWHKSCFTCGGCSDHGCGRVLAFNNYQQHGGWPYCTACFNHNFRQGGVLGAEVPTDEYRRYLPEPEPEPEVVEEPVIVPTEEPTMNPDDSPEEIYLSSLNFDDEMNAFLQKTRTSLAPKEKIYPTSTSAIVMDDFFNEEEEEEEEDCEEAEAEISILTGNTGMSKPVTKVLENFTVPFNEHGSLYFGDNHQSAAGHEVVAPPGLDKQWLELDLGHGRLLCPTRYCIRNGGPAKGDTLRNWELRGRVSERDDWIVLRTHTNDRRLVDRPYSTAVWRLQPKSSILKAMRDVFSNPQQLVNHFKGGAHKTWGDIPGFRHFMLVQTGPNSSGNDHLLIGGLELFGTLTECLEP